MYLGVPIFPSVSILVFMFYLSIAFRASFLVSARVCLAEVSLLISLQCRWRL
jgi:hypothetical protein